MMKYMCGHCGYVEDGRQIPSSEGLSAVFCGFCGRNNEMEKLTTKPVKIFMYGTLKEGGINHYKLSYNGKKPISIGKHIIKGYTLYTDSYKSYPIAVKDENESITGEIWVVNPTVYYNIRCMEIGAGYTEVKQDNLIFYIYERDRRNYKIHIGSTWKIKKRK